MNLSTHTDASLEPLDGAPVGGLIRLRSGLLGFDLCLSYSLPAGSGDVDGERFPVVYFLHGRLPETSRERPDGPIRAEAMISQGWEFADVDGRHQKDLAEKTGAVIIGLNGGDSGYRNEPKPWQTHILEEALPVVESLLPADPKRRAITGHSMGGSGAIAMALLYPGIFRAAAARSAAFTLGPLGPVLQAMEKERARSNVPSVDAGDLLPRNEPGLPALSGEIRLALSFGREDRIMDGSIPRLNRLLHRILQERGIGHLYEETNDGHECRPYIAAMVRWAGGGRFLDVGSTRVDCTL